MKGTWNICTALVTAYQAPADLLSSLKLNAQCFVSTNRSSD